MKLLLPLLIFILPLFSQNKQAGTVVAVHPDTVFSDCGVARVIKISGPVVIGPVMPPPGPGVANEISRSKHRSGFVFREEHHSAWYKLVIGFSGHLCFNVVPLNKADDYDFVLYKAGPFFCDSLGQDKITPIRACISRDKEEVEGKTGLSYKGKKELVKEGVNDAFAKPLYVTKGETYYLILDNVYPEGKGHILQFYFEEPFEMSGVVKDEEDQPVKAEIALTNGAGDTVYTTRAKADGTYRLKTFLSPTAKYSLNFYNDSSFVFSRTIMLKDTMGLNKLKTVLPKLKKGKRSSVGSINFYGNEVRYLPGSLPCMKNLARLMHKNPDLEIMIVGHVNGCVSLDKDVLKLSQERAETIMKYLVRNKIQQSRIKMNGMGCKEMLYPDPATEWQAEQNRRVEILVLDY